MTKPLNNLVVPLLALPRSAKRTVALSVDTSLCELTVWLAYYLRLGEFVPLSGNALFAVAAAILLSLPIFIVSGLYRAIFRYSGWPALLTVARAVGIYGTLYASIFTAIGIPDVPRTKNSVTSGFVATHVCVPRKTNNLSPNGTNGSAGRPTHARGAPNPGDAPAAGSGRRSAPRRAARWRRLRPHP